MCTPAAIAGWPSLNNSLNVFGLMLVLLYVRSLNRRTDNVISSVVEQAPEMCRKSTPAGQRRLVKPEDRGSAAGLARLQLGNDQ